MATGYIPLDITEAGDGQSAKTRIRNYRSRPRERGLARFRCSVSMAIVLSFARWRDVWRRTILIVPAFAILSQDDIEWSRQRRAASACHCELSS